MPPDVAIENRVFQAERNDPNAGKQSRQGGEL
jgi:hypothetical protein